MTNLTAMHEIFKADGRRVVVDGRRAYDLCAVIEDAIAWDGAAKETTNTLYHSGRDMYSYVELRETGHRERIHAGGAFGMKGRMRFTGADDSGEWIDVVIVSAATCRRAA